MDPSDIQNQISQSAQSNQSQPQASLDSALPPNQPPTNTSKKGWLIALVVMAAIFIVLPLIAMIVLYVSFSGGIDGLVSELKSAPNPNSKALVASRESAKSSIDKAFSELEANTQLTTYGTSVHDRCYEGQNNWKVKEGYSHRCTYRVTNYYGFNDNFRTKMINFENQIIDSGWKPRYSSGYPIKEDMEFYYDKYYGPDKLKPASFRNQYLVSNLPTPTSGYAKDKNVLYVEYAERATNDLFSIDYAQNDNHGSVSSTYEKKQFQDVNKLFKTITAQNNYVLVVSIQQTYFEN